MSQHRVENTLHILAHFPLYRRSRYKVRVGLVFNQAIAFASWLNKTIETLGKSDTELGDAEFGDESQDTEVHNDGDIFEEEQSSDDWHLKKNYESGLVNEILVRSLYN